MAHLPCPAELWPEFSTLLDEALELAPEEQRVWLQALAPCHAAVRPWLEKVLLQQTSPANSRFMDAPAGSQLQEAEFAPQQCIGPYQLERLLGRGGMGEVWLAMRSDRTPNRRIALKLPHAFLLAGVHRRRFERERDILAALSHPHIAQLYDAGVADDKHPYLAMEWVDGLPIHQWCRAHKLDLDARLDLFRQVLEAVGYAHTQFIAHRDLKPSNILVTQSGQVKLLDFGIAKLLDGERGAEATELTRAGGRAVTPDYAAPEQLDGAPVTTAVDVYALGVVLHELLSGRRPPPASLTVEPALRLASGQVEAAHAASVAALQPRALRRALSGDLDAILVKALARDPARRYRSVEAFAEDLQRSREHRPISARHIGPATLMLKFVQRHQLGVAMSFALVATLVLGSAGVAWQAVRAEREAQRATQIKDFLVSMFRASDPSVASDKPRGSITARELLDLNADRIEKEFAGDPKTAIELLGVTANIYFGLDELERYAELHQRYETLARSEYGELDATYLGSQLDDVYAAIERGDEARATRLLDRLDAPLKQSRFDHSAIRGRWWQLRGQTLKLSASSRNEQKNAFDRAIALLGATGVAPSDDLQIALVERGFVALNSLSFPEATDFFRRALSVGQTIRPRNDGLLQRANFGLGQALSYLGDHAAADTAFETARLLALQTYGADKWPYWETVASFARVVHVRGERERADAMFDSVVAHLPEIDAAQGSAADRSTGLAVRVQYARCLVDEGHADRAIRLIEQHTLGLSPDDNSVNHIRLNLVLGNAYLNAGRLAEARALLAWSEGQLSARVDTGNAELLFARERYGSVLLASGDAGNAQRQFDAVVDGAAGSASESAARSIAGLAELALLRHEPKSALELSITALDTLRRAPGLVSVRVRPELQRVYAEALLAADDAPTALQQIREAAEQLSKFDDASSAELIRIKQRMAELNSRTARYDTARLKL